MIDTKFNLNQTVFIVEECCDFEIDEYKVVGIKVKVSEHGRNEEYEIKRISDSYIYHIYIDVSTNYFDTLAEAEEYQRKLKKEKDGI